MRLVDRRRMRPALTGLIAVAGCVGVACVPAVCAASALPVEDAATAATVRISVLSLFHPREMIVVPVPGSRLEMMAGNEQVTIGVDEGVRVRLDGKMLSIAAGHDETTLHADAVLMKHAEPFVLEIPGKLRRRYAGLLTIAARGSSLEAVIEMPLETAVASIVAAESPPGAPVEAMKAQAVATRSFLATRRSGHVGFDFCDTTHCQFLRSPPAENSVAARAAGATRGLVLTWHNAATAQEEPVAAMYARSCGGETRSLRQVGVRPDGYPYYAVRCAYCRRHAEVWRRQLRDVNAPRTERDRLLFNRVHGWGALPSLADETSFTDDEASGDEARTITGRGIGHGIGLCQLGAADMARHGASFDRILAHYYPNTQIRELAVLSAGPAMR